MKKLILTTLVLMGLSFNTKAQNFSHAIGLRLGSPISVSYKYFLNDSHALEIVGGTSSYGYRYSSYRYRWYNLGASYLVHKSFDSNIEILQELQWYYGGGANVYFWRWENRYVPVEDSYSSTTFGIQGNIGIEYNFKNIPLNLSLDWSPSIFLNGFHSGVGAGFGALAVRYIIK